jgi:hypothetical protein
MMEIFEEKIIDLVDVIAEPDPSRTPEKALIKNPEEKTVIQSPPAFVETPVKNSEGKPDVRSIPEQTDFEKIIHKEVEQTLQDMVGEHIQKQIDLEIMIKKEIEQSLRSIIGEHIQSIIKEILAQEIQKAITREIEGLKKTK